MNTYIDASLRPLVQRLHARYPGVSVLWAHLDARGVDGALQQTIRYQAPLERLRKCGLVTSEMMEYATGGRRRCTNISRGDGYSLIGRSLDAQGQPGDWDLVIHTGAVPRERDRISVREAQRELRRFMLPRRRRSACEVKVAIDRQSQHRGAP